MNVKKTSFKRETKLFLPQTRIDLLKKIIFSFQLSLILFHLACTKTDSTPQGYYFTFELNNKAYSLNDTTLYAETFGNLYVTSWAMGNPLSASIVLSDSTTGLYYDFNLVSAQTKYITGFTFHIADFEDPNFGDYLLPDHLSDIDPEDAPVLEIDEVDAQFVKGHFSGLWAGPNNEHVKIVGQFKVPFE